jgi:hypothetical protein
MALNPTITYIVKIGTQIRVGFKLTPSGSYPSGGDTLNFATAAVDPNFVGNVPSVEALGAPISMDVWSAGGNITIIYVAVLGTTNANCKVKLATALGSEATAEAYSSISSTIATDTIVGEATFNAL